MFGPASCLGAAFAVSSSSLRSGICIKRCQWPHLLGVLLTVSRKRLMEWLSSQQTGTSVLGKATDCPLVLQDQRDLGPANRGLVTKQSSWLLGALPQGNPGDVGRGQLESSNSWSGTPTPLHTPRAHDSRGSRRTLLPVGEPGPL